MAQGHSCNNYSVKGGGLLMTGSHGTAAPVTFVRVHASVSQVTALLNKKYYRNDSSRLQELSYDVYPYCMSLFTIAPSTIFFSIPSSLSSYR